MENQILFLDSIKIRLKKKTKNMEYQTSRSLDQANLMQYSTPLMLTEPISPPRQFDSSPQPGGAGGLKNPPNKNSSTISANNSGAASSRHGVY